MAQDPPISRRTVLFGGASLLAASTLPSVVRGRLGPGEAEDPLARRLRELVDSASVRVLGRPQLADLPARETGAEVARGLLPPGFDEQAALAATDDALVAALDTRIRDDLRAGALVPVAGWLLSWTEARLCVLTVLQR